MQLLSTMKLLFMISLCLASILFFNRFQAQEKKKNTGMSLTDSLKPINGYLPKMSYCNPFCGGSSSSQSSSASLPQSSSLPRIIQGHNCTLKQYTDAFNHMLCSSPLPYFIYSLGFMICLELQEPENNRCEGIFQRHRHLTT